MHDDSGPPRTPPDWDQRYVDGELPWDTGKPDAHLHRVIDEFRIAPGKALEVGCGSGTNVIWLAQQGFDVVGLDLSPTAIERARAKASAAEVSCRLLSLDFLAEPVPGGPFELVYDRGCFHVFRTAEARASFAARVAALLEPEGMWTSLIGSTDGPPRDTGPPRHRATDVIAAVEPHFEILGLRSTSFDENHPVRAWVLVARRRDS